MWYRTGTVTLKKGTNKVLGIGTKWFDKLSNVESGQPFIVNNNIYEIIEVRSDTELYLKESALADATNSAYVIMSVVYGSLGDVALKASKALAHYQEQMQVFDQMYSGTEPFTVIKPDGSQIEMYPYSLLSINLTELNQTIQTVANYATNAESSATQAQSSASDASQHALNASNSAKQSKDSATQSAESANKSLLSANDSASSATNASQSASQSKLSAEEAKQAALSASNKFNKDMLIQEFEALSEDEKKIIKDHLGVEMAVLNGALLSENNLIDVSSAEESAKNLSALTYSDKEVNIEDSDDNKVQLKNFGVFVNVVDKNNRLSNLGINAKDSLLLNLPQIPSQPNEHPSQFLFASSGDLWFRRTGYVFAKVAAQNRKNEYTFTQQFTASTPIELKKTSTTVADFLLKFLDNNTPTGFVGLNKDKNMVIGKGGASTATSRLVFKNDGVYIYNTDLRQEEKLTSVEQFLETLRAMYFDEPYGLFTDVVSITTDNRFEPGWSVSGPEISPEIPGSWAVMSRIKNEAGPGFVNTFKRFE